jgi:hypothetical protein
VNIPASKLLDHIHPDAPFVTIRTQDGTYCFEVSYEDLRALVAAEYVCGISRSRGKLREIRLTVPRDVAFREVGETHAKVRDQLHCDANRTTERSESTLPKSRSKLKHHRRTRQWPIGMGIPRTAPTPSASSPTQRDLNIIRDYQATDESGTQWLYSVEELHRRHSCDGTVIYRALAITGTQHRTNGRYVAPGANPDHRDRKEEKCGPVTIAQGRRGDRSVVAIPEIPEIRTGTRIRWMNAIPPSLPGGGLEMLTDEGWRNVPTELIQSIQTNQLVTWG